MHSEIFYTFRMYSRFAVVVFVSLFVLHRCKSNQSKQEINLATSLFYLPIHSVYLLQWKRECSEIFQICVKSYFIYFTLPLLLHL